MQWSMLRQNACKMFYIQVEHLGKFSKKEEFLFINIKGREKIIHLSICQYSRSVGAYDICLSKYTSKCAGQNIQWIATDILHILQSMQTCQCLRLNIWLRPSVCKYSLDQALFLVHHLELELKSSYLHEMLVLITSVNSKVSDKLAHMHSLVKTFTTGINKI